MLWHEPMGICFKYLGRSNGSFINIGISQVLNDH